MTAAPQTQVKTGRTPGGRSVRGAGAWLFGAVGILALLILWEVYKFLGPDEGVSIGGTLVLPRTHERSMPHLWEMAGRLADPGTGTARDSAMWEVVASATLFSFGIAAVGWAVGVVVGLALALIMLRWKVAEWGLLPWIILSQTVPIIAFAPVVRNWGLQIEGWEQWMSVALIASWLAFFPVAVGALKGFQSPETAHVELMRTYAVGWWATLLRLRVPAAVPYLLSSFRLAAANAVIGAIVAEVSTNLQGGIGRLLFESAQRASMDPPGAWSPIFGAVALGLVAAGSVAFLGFTLRKYRRTEGGA